MARYSIIVATHARPRLLERAIQSIKSQTIPDVQVVVVSDERSSELYAAARQYLSGDDIFVERGGAPGPARSRTVGMSVANGDWIAFLDDDDEFSAGFLAGIEPYAAASPESILFCDYLVVNDGEDRLTRAATPPVHLSTAARDPLTIYVQNFIANSCLLYPAAVVRNKAFDEALVLNEDWDFLLNAVEGEGGHRYSLVHVPVVGPIIHKTDRARADRRGAVNDHLLPDNMLQIYRKWSAPTHTLKAARQALFASVGINLPLATF